ncbi:hypothetical protein BHAOGJBA_5301 [Methylobacterium hispanicum]|uniref:Uncharacterized protein n=1 Tax=Methylobacterium hispanicum TaxID=270350 RepID=A0AAV4ZTZ4_9HYPH|nr:MULTISPECIES: hypothetical protein [Methylobacterium]MBE7244900.1 hypothetical protein [Actinomycetospora chiangmaiensis]GJD91748.1 hypothetical protein BHAOGJBA_5301 [Methylobacterium hispanicum]
MRRRILRGGLLRRGALLAPLLAAGPVAAQPLTAGSPCGGNAYSSAEVREGRPARRGPLVAVPDTLCADLDGPRPDVRVDVYGLPGPGTGPYADPYGGAPGPGTPYEGRFRRGP